jgi:hypothetical protein
MGSSNRDVTVLTLVTVKNYCDTGRAIRKNHHILTLQIKLPVAHRQHDIIWLSTGINREQYIISME